MIRFYVRALSISFLAGLTVGAQTLATSEFHGTVLDQSRSAVPEAHLTLTSIDRGISFSAQTNNDGYFSFATLLPGSYALRVEKSGFSTYQRTGLTAVAGEKIEVNISMETGSVQQTVTVTADAPALQTGNNEIGNTVDNRNIEALPLQSRDYTGLLNVSVNSRSFTLDTRSGVGTVLGGTRYNAISISIDGVDNNTVFFNRDNVRPSLEGVEEVRAISNSPSAEYGRNLGAVVSIVTKSGSNTFHGSLFEYHQDNHLDARNAFSTVASPFYLNNRFGGSFGGPIRKDKLFIFGNIEVGYQRSSNASNISVPPAAFRSGNFAGANTIYDPATTMLIANGTYTRSPFPGNIIPATSMDSGRRQRELPPPHGRSGILRRRLTRARLVVGAISINTTFVEITTLIPKANCLCVTPQRQPTRIPRMFYPPNLMVRPPAASRERMP